MIWYDYDLIWCDIDAFVLNYAIPCYNMHGMVKFSTKASIYSNDMIRSDKIRGDVIWNDKVWWCDVIWYDIIMIRYDIIYLLV